MNFDFNFWQIAFFAANFLLTFYVAVSNRHKVKTDDLNAVKSDLNAKIVKLLEDKADLAERVASMESDIKNAVNDQDLIAVHKRVDEIAAKLGPVQGRLDEISANLQPMNGTLQTLSQQLGVVQGMLSVFIKQESK
ncbi:MAG: hypothetical protein PHH59_14385 [Methylovulum sp.]|uniref:hypothetical protein n=1 Tax=Methylovulum sp. TaxID=1916980 RepID=UPI00260DAB0E|nr:hypothetical protein [Methylovulum sp.]MDD2725193.1 hypothetical protein [Methylovulum sp.]MDD5125448.1 hypothetical protein [Methylovulum sp.]